VPKNPNCESCVLNDGCLALQKRKVAQLPVKLKKTKVTTRFFDYLVFWDEQSKTIIKKRSAKGIWHNLYEFPLIESEELLSEEIITKQINQQLFIANEVTDVTLYNPEIIVHKLSHQHLNIRFWKVNVKGEIQHGMHCESVKGFPFPIVVFNFISNYWN
jgi:A/G-specific adenine glycosylase